MLEKVSHIDTSLWKVIKDSPLHKDACMFLHTTWGTLRNGVPPPIFPGPQPTSIARRHFPTLKQNHYYACEKTDGTRYGLMCLMSQGKKICLIVNRALDMYLVSMNMPRNAYKGTFLDGELVKFKDGSWNFVVYDGVSISGEHIGALILEHRLGVCHQFCTGILQTSKDPLKKVYVKKFWVMNDLQNLLAQDFPYETDGLVFTPNNEPIRVGTHDTLFKWKPRDKNTIDFQVKKRKNAWGLYVQEKGSLIFESEIHDEGDFKEDMILECKYITNLRKWSPIGVRTDKHHPNNRRTFYKTLENIREDIQVHEFW